MSETIKIHATAFTVFSKDLDPPYYTLQFYDEKAKKNILITIEEIEKLAEAITKELSS